MPMSDPSNLGRGRVTRLPQGLLGMLALVLIVELTIAGRRARLYHHLGRASWRCSAEAASLRSKDYDLLCFGDSLVKFSVLPKEIEAKTGLRSFNLAIKRTRRTMPSAYWPCSAGALSSRVPSQKPSWPTSCTLMVPGKLLKEAIRPLPPNWRLLAIASTWHGPARDSGFLLGRACWPRSSLPISAGSRSGRASRPRSKGVGRPPGPCNRASGRSG